MGREGVWGFEMWLNWDSSDWVSCSSRLVPTEKNWEFSSHVVESHTAFISWRLWPTSHSHGERFPTKKSVSITFPLGQMGQIKCGFILLWPIPVQLLQADTLMLILCDDWDAAAVINVFFGIHVVSIRQIGWRCYQWLTFLKLHVKKQKKHKGKYLQF